MTDFTIDELLERRGVSGRHTRLVRHDKRGLIEWKRSVEHFDHWVSYQRNDNRSPYNHARTAIQFVPESSNHAVFVGAHDIGDSWAPSDNSTRRPSLFHEGGDYVGKDSHRVYDLDRRSGLEDLVGRVVIDWGSSTRSWSQWMGKGKPIVEIRASAAEEQFPGFSRIVLRVEDVPLIPSAWQGALASVGGIYLLVCNATGEQYVGSAFGDGGFLGRWTSYASNGHGGNKLLISRRSTDYSVSILEIASPDMAMADIIRRETAWKRKLGSRAHGLNAN